MEETSRDAIGMPSLNSNDVAPGTQTRDTQRGNPLGDQVDNTSGSNDAGVNIAQGRGTSKGAYLHMQSIAPNIYKQTSY